MIPIILSGGSGTRLWPVSRSEYPKQFCKIFDKSLHELTLDRLASFGRPLIVASARQKNLILKYSDPSSIFLFEPVQRNTAPAIGLACKWLQMQGQEESIAGVFPSDHLVKSIEAFKDSVSMASAEASNGKVVVVGLEAQYPATGYGYIETNITSSQTRSVTSFKEKPSQQIAESYIKSGNFFWNAGIFVFQVSTMIEIFKAEQPLMWQQIDKIKSDLSNLGEVYESLDSISMDYAIIEKLDSKRLSCVVAEFGWSDVGSWDAVANISDKDDANNFSLSYNGKKTIFCGVNDLIIIDTKDALLVTKKGASENIKPIVENMKSKKMLIADEHTFAVRPWGQYQVLEDDQDFKSKVITVDPGQRLSYQSHEKREEHWVIVSGQGAVILNEKEIPVTSGSYVHIPKQAKHRIANYGDTPLKFIEVQMGSYFGEDDITRYQDDYSRS